MAAPVVYDCVQFVVVRDGSLLLRTAADHQRPVGPGDIVLVVPRVSLTYEPEGAVAATTILIDVDYLIEHLFW